MEKVKESVISLPIQLSELASGLVFISVSILSFFAPFGLGHPQWFVGTAVNACLFLTAIFLPKKYWLPIAILPSLGMLARGLVFGPLTMFLVYFLPFIWLGNLVLLFIFSKIAIPKKVGIAVFVSALAKFLFLFIIANIYFKFSIVPALFLQTMGIFQLLTAVGGGLVSFLIFKTYGKSFNRG